MFDSDENAIVDFKYAASEKLTWWFDHHESAFLTPEDEAHFRADKSGQKFLDPTRKSCTEFIADVAHERFGFNPAPIQSLVHWAHIIEDRKSTRLNSSHSQISYAVFCLK